MADQFYYFVASLPDLRFDEKPPLSAAAFLDRCRGVLSERAVGTLEAVHRGVEGEPPDGAAPVPKVLGRWLARESALRNALAGMRAHRLGADPSRHQRRASPDLEAARVAREAFDTTSPREAEDLLDRTRWQWLEELESGYYFDLERVAVYLLKLRLLERRAMRSRDAGRAAVERFRTVACELSRQACASNQPPS